MGYSVFVELHNGAKNSFFVHLIPLSIFKIFFRCINTTLLITLVNKFKHQSSMKTSKELKTLFWIYQWMSVMVLKLAYTKLVLTYIKCKNYEKRMYAHFFIWIIWQCSVNAQNMAAALNCTLLNAPFCNFYPTVLVVE